METKIQEKIQILKQIQERNDERREYWESFAKNNIISACEKVMSISSKLKLDSKEDFVNLESLVLTFGTEPTGIKDQRRLIEIPKLGGHISFAQIFNGQVAISICYPHIKDVTGLISNRWLGVFEPDELNINFVLEKIEAFFDEMIKWEKGDVTS